MPREESRFRYHEIASDLRAGILRGEYRTQGRLPSERLLGQRFGVQRATVRQALRVLEDEGHIATETKRGSFLTDVAPPAGDLALLLPTGSSPHLAHLTDGLTRAAKSLGLGIRRVESHHAKGAFLDPVPPPESFPKGTAGIVHWPQNPTDEPALARLNAAFPLVLVDRRVSGVPADCVRFDDLAGGRMVTEHLLEQGHRRVAFFTDDILAEPVRLRWQGYVAALESAGIPLEPALAIFLNGIHEPLFSIVLDHLLGRPDPPTAFVCSNDIVAFRLLRYLQSHGRRVPDDVAVAGYGNTMPDYLQAMGLTTMDQRFADLGERAAHLLFERLGRRDPCEARDVTIPVTLIVRRSTAGAPLPGPAR